MRDLAPLTPEQDLRIRFILSKTVNHQLAKGTLNIPALQAAATEYVTAHRRTEKAVASIGDYERVEDVSARLSAALDQELAAQNTLIAVCVEIEREREERVRRAVMNLVQAAMKKSQ